MPKIINNENTKQITGNNIEVVTNAIASQTTSELSSTDCKTSQTTSEQLCIDYPETEVGDRAICKVTGIDYNSFCNLPAIKQIELAENNIRSVFDLLLKEIMVKYNLYPHFLIDNYIGKVSAEHISSCNCFRELVNYYYDISSKKQLLTEHKNSNTYVLNRHDAIERINLNRASSNNLDTIYKNVAKYINRVDSLYTLPFCPTVYRELLQTIELFGKDYDLSKAKVQQVVKGIIIYQISLIETIHYQTNNGMYEKVVDKWGNVKTYVADNEKYKLMLNEKILSAVKQLDEMVEGSKSVNINLDTQHVPLDVLIKKMKG